MNPGHVLKTALLAAALLASTLAAQGVEKEADRAKLISLNSQVIDVTAPPEKIPAHLVARASAAGVDPYLLVKFSGPTTARQLAALQASGARIHTYLPYFTYLVKMPPTAAEHGKALRAIKAAAGA